MKTFKYIILTIAAIAGLYFASGALGLFGINFWGVKYQDAHTKVFEQTKAYKHGVIRDVQNLCLEMERVESQSHKNAIKATINHRLSGFDYDDLPEHVKSCLRN